MAELDAPCTPTFGANTYLPACMSLIAGAVDVTSWLTLGGLFAAHITGNVVVVAAAIVQGRHPHTAQALAVPVFVLAVVVADLIASRVGTSGYASSTHLLSLQAALLCGAFLLSLLRARGAVPDERVALVQAMLAVSAMATQNALLHLTRKKVPTTAVMTGNLVQATVAALDMLRPSSRLLGEENWSATWPLITCFVFGCAGGAASVKLGEPWAWLVPAVISLVYVLWFYVTQSSTRAKAEELPL